MTRRDAWLLAGGVAVGVALAVETRRTRRRVDLGGRVALITGGSRGLGLLIARQLGLHGARVVIVARDEHELERAVERLTREGIDAAFIVADVTDDRAARQLVEAVV